MSRTNSLKCLNYKVNAHEGSVDALLEAERVAEATKQAIKRKIVQAASIDLQSRSLPAKLRIEADDPEDVVSCFSKFSSPRFLSL